MNKGIGVVKLDDSACGIQSGCSVHVQIDKFWSRKQEHGLVHLALILIAEGGTVVQVGQGKGLVFKQLNLGVGPAQQVLDEGWNEADQRGLSLLVGCLEGRLTQKMVAHRRQCRTN